ncbi:GTP-binding protein [Priestia flexa]|jgi:G3E family GTPase|uniref:GTP-binding protein n=1 Tax=Priestia flexa TaxID=86664 RepID=A0A8I1MHM3_9BACI|nr:CobW family GTP-binding protein [Priestia flexa]AQX55157.1 cobalamin biosynthesis protein [Priestia flexa]MBN8253320.1 GTP-binding protein [Priestia flexa]MBN8435744.1 GTP-binding protein [Priestia flexa]MBY6087606.1 GTP-binding protein [Priestia flexa]MCA0968299.1 GTP-binding protein [Priestia flexa]
MINKTEIYILSGFLGSGKTSLLKNALKQEKENGRQIAVIMNELGKVSIDSDEVEEDTPLKELLNGCVCCTIQGQFETQLHSLLQENKLDAIYIETTGVAHPIEVLDACMSPLFANDVVVKCIVTTVDVHRWQDRGSLSIQLQKLLQEQIRHADVILLNKADTLSESAKAALLYEVQSINPQAACVFTSYSSIQLKLLTSAKLSEKQAHQQAHVEKQLHLKTFVYEFKNSVDLEKFEDWLRHTPDTIYRMKGYLRFTHSTDTYSFQYSYGMPLYMKELMKMPTNLVIIGENLRHEQLKKELTTLDQV